MTRQREMELPEKNRDIEVKVDSQNELESSEWKTGLAERKEWRAENG